MNDETLLLRQIHPSFLKNGELTSQAFMLMPKDQNRLSCEDGDRTDATTAWKQYTKSYQSVGVRGVKVLDVHSLELEVDPDGVPIPTHVSIVFPDGLSKNRLKSLSKKLREFSNPHGWLFRDHPE